MNSKRNIFRYAVILGSAVGMLPLISCSIDDSDACPESDAATEAPILLHVSPAAPEVAIQTRATATNILDDDMRKFISNDEFIDKKTRIRVRLAGSGEDGWDFSGNYFEYIYDQQLEEETTKSDLTRIFNFTPWMDDSYAGSVGPGVTWSNLMQYTANNVIPIYAALFSKTYSFANARSISEDQDTADDMLTNDVLLAFHQINGTEQGNWYFQLTLHHVYSMLVIQVQIPIYHPDDGLGFDKMNIDDLLRIDKQGNTSEKLSVDIPIEELEVVQKQLTVSYSTPASDQCPIVTINPNSASELKDLRMCLLAVYPPETDPAYEGREVQKYLYACILPPSSAFSSPIRLRVKNAVTQAEERYTSSTFTSPDSSSDIFQLQQGHITCLKLTLSRGANSPVLVKGDVLPWGTANAELGLVQSGPGNDDSRPTD